ncbi:MAG: class I poly(R)-hydroxyalkanoic acid synthase, partial [Thiothrix sp.]|nr:class I poly(R)-hydroxyalkanoic acid synthase [Thiothrix sp.]
MPDQNPSGVNTLGFAAKEMEANFKKVEEIMSGFAKSYEDMNLDPFNLSQLYRDWLTAMSKNPDKLVQANVEFWQKSMQLTQQAFASLSGQKAETAVINEERGDRRFKHAGWDEEPVFNLIKQSYLLTSDWARKLASNADGLDERTAERVKFFTERALDSLSPTNFAMTNPAVIEKIKETKGANLVHGLKNMLEDLEEGKGMLRIRMTDTRAFELGKNVAITPGKVIFQNRMFQLIQYAPSTEKVLKRPLLIIPPWINKFYILHLQAQNSLIKWVTEQGYTLFEVSWV